MVKMFEIEVPVTGREVYIVEAESFEEARTYLRLEAPNPDYTEVDWDGDFNVVDEWEEN